jgi:hypothetical protein
MLSSRATGMGLARSLREPTNIVVNKAAASEIAGFVSLRVIKYTTTDSILETITNQILSTKIEEPKSLNSNARR